MLILSLISLRAHEVFSLELRKMWRKLPTVVLDAARIVLSFWWRSFSYPQTSYIFIFDGVYNLYDQLIQNNFYRKFWKLFFWTNFRQYFTEQIFVNIFLNKFSWIFFWTNVCKYFSIQTLKNIFWTNFHSFLNKHS